MRGEKEWKEGRVGYECRKIKEDMGWGVQGEKEEENIRTIVSHSAQN